MSENMLDEAFEEEEQDLELDEETTEEEQEEQPQYVTADQLEDLKQTIASLSSNLQPQNSAQTQQSKPALSEAEIAEMGKNPAKLLSYVQELTQQNNQKLQNEQQRMKWDEKAYRDFPALKEDKKFQCAVVNKMKELVSSGAMQKDNPQLIHLAAQVTSATYKGSTGAQMAKKSQDSLPPRRSTGASAPKGSSKDVREDPNYAALRLRYGSDKEIKEVLERHKKRVTSVGRAGRRVINLGGM